MMHCNNRFHLQISFTEILTMFYNQMNGCMNGNIKYQRLGTEKNSYIFEKKKKVV